MRRPRNQNGSSLILLIGIVAALAIMAASLVVLSRNVQSNTQRDRYRMVSFNAAESAVDTAMYQLGTAWPTDTASAPTFDTTAFLSSLRTSGDALATPQPIDLPSPQAHFGSAASVTFFDNADLTPVGGWPAGYSAANPPPWDANGDDKMYVRAQIGVGDFASRVQVEVQRTYVNTSFPHGIAVAAGGNVTSNGGGNNPKVTIEVQGSQGVTAYVGGTVDNPAAFAGAIGINPGGFQPIDSLFPPTLIQQIVDMAKGMNRYYDLTAGATMPADISGVCVIKAADGANISIGNNGSINSQTSPGILIILSSGANNVTLDMGGNCTFWGILYTEGVFQSAHGTPSIHGMVICKSNLDMKGTPNIMYNDSVIAKLSNKWTLAIKQLKDTWTELAPVLN